LADLTLAATTWLVNDDKTNTYLGITPFLFLPTGTYDKNQATELGRKPLEVHVQSGYQRGITDKLSIVFLETQLFLAITISSVRPLQR